MDSRMMNRCAFEYGGSDDLRFVSRLYTLTFVTPRVIPTTSPAQSVCLIMTFAERGRTLGFANR